MSVQTLNAIYTGLLYACAIGQAIFVIAWMTVKWYSTWVGRALMFKSLSLSVTLLVVSYFRYKQPHFSVETFYKVYIVLFVMLFLGITSQDIAILRELWLKKKEGGSVDS